MIAIPLLTLALTFAFGMQPSQAADEIHIGFLSPLSGGLTKPGTEAKWGFELFWDEMGHKAGGKTIKVSYADSACNPDATINQGRRLIFQEKVDFLVGPFCGHAGVALAQVAVETKTPLILFIAGGDNLTKWGANPLVVRTGFCSSQDSHAFGEWLYKEKGLRNVTFIGQDYTFGQEKTLGAVDTFKQSGGKVAKIIWAPMNTKDYGPLLAGIPTDSDGVVATVVGGHRIKFFQQWFDFGYDRKFKVFGLHWLQTDALETLNDDQANGLVSQALPYAQGIDTPENKKFMDLYIKKHKSIPSYGVEMAYTSGLFIKAALDAVGGNVADKEAFLNAVRKAKVVAPRGPMTIDEYNNPVQNVYISEARKIKHETLGEVWINVPVKTYKNVSQFWNWDPEEYLKRGPYKR
jgi:branched-chain amino acid transport system substrate-binding protein